MWPGHSSEEADATARWAHGEVRLAHPANRLPAPGPGIHAVTLGGGQGGHVYIPSTRSPAAPGPIAIVLHGAGGQSRPTLELLRAHADQAALVLLAPQSRGPSWDLIGHALGPDVATIDGLLGWVNARLAIDRTRIAIGGFSDGASYALSLGLANGDLFTAVLAFSPGFASPPRRTGKPRLFISHGTKDAVLPIDRCSRALVPRLRRLGYDVTYDEFEGPHTVPEPIAAHAVHWWLD
jgi:phospholipase/carboxylesterase